MVILIIVGVVFNNVNGWKYNSSLLYDEFYNENMKNLITEINTSNEFNKDAQMK